MHIQARAQPAKSAPDLEAFFKVLSEPDAPRAPINIEGVTGGNVETGGEIVFSFDHDRLQDVKDWLEEADYKPTFLEDEIAFAEMEGNEPGQLLRIIRGAAAENIAAGRIIRDVLIGEQTGNPGHFYVQISFQEVRTG